jgi:hypothetical protein
MADKTLEQLLEEHKTAVLNVILAAREAATAYQVAHEADDKEGAARALQTRIEDEILRMARARVQP